MQSKLAYTEAVGHRSVDLADLLLDGGYEDASDYLMQLQMDGYDPAYLVQHLIFPTCKLIGTYWEEDRWSFCDVTAASATLSLIIRRWSEDIKGEALPEQPGIVATIDPEQHTLVTELLGFLIRGAGHPVRVFSRIHPSRLVAHCVDIHPAYLVFSVSTPRYLDLLREAIADIRRLGITCPIFVGGTAFDELPERASVVGATLYCNSPETLLVELSQRVGKSPTVS